MQLGGFYYDDSGAGVSGKTVKVYARNTVTPEIGTDTTDSEGYWQVTGLAEGRYDFEIVDGSIKRRGQYDDEVQFESLDIATLYLRNPADTFAYAVTPGAIVANRVLNLPLITGTDTLAVLGLAQTFSAVKTFSAIPVMSGGAVGFPASQAASATANDLDDYEEGSWTPAVGGDATYTTQTGRYIKVGKKVWAAATITINVH